MSYYADKGAFADSKGKTRKVTYIQKDDGYDPARTIPLVDELIDSEKVFAMITLGSPNTLKTYDKLNQRCIPHIFNQTGHPAWGDPVNHPWTTGLGLAYTTEAVLWGAFIDDHIASSPMASRSPRWCSTTSSARSMTPGSGPTSTPRRTRTRSSTSTRRSTRRRPTITDPMTTLAAENPDFFIAMVAGTFCTQTVVEAAAERHARERQVPLAAQHLRRRHPAQQGQGRRRRRGVERLVDRQRRQQGHPRPAQQSDPAVVWARQCSPTRGTTPTRPPSWASA